MAAGRQIRHGGDGTGLEARSEHTRTLLPKQHGAEVARSVCPYCAVGCGQLIYHKDGKLVSIEGDPASPVSRGRLCPKGSASFELLTHPARLDKVRYRRPRGTQWEDLGLETAMDMIADRLWDSRERTFEEERDGRVLMHDRRRPHRRRDPGRERDYLIKAVHGRPGDGLHQQPGVFDTAPRCRLGTTYDGAEPRRRPRTSALGRDPDHGIEHGRTAVMAFQWVIEAQERGHA